MAARRVPFVVLLTGLLVMTPGGTSLLAQRGAQNGEWRAYGGDKGGTKYSPARPDHTRQLRQPQDGVAVEDARRLPEQADARRRRMVRPARGDRSSARAGDAKPLPRTEYADHVEFPGDAPHGGRLPVPHHRAVTGCIGRRAHRPDPLDLQPAKLRRRDYVDDRHMAAARRRLLERRQRRARVLGYRERLPDLRRREERPSVPGFRQQGTNRPHARACRARTARIAIT